MAKKSGGNRETQTEEKSIAYFMAVVRNSMKNEYRQNDNAAEHITPTGIWFDGYKAPLTGAEDAENQIANQTAEDWLLFINNEHLHTALSTLKHADLDFVFVFYKHGYTERQMAELLGVTQQTVHRRRKKILKLIKSFF